ncbi:MAG: J domain-containing protein [Caldilineaceae bacterium]
MKDYHRILEVSADATEMQIREQYKRLVRIYHPDRFTNSQDKVYVEQKFKEITAAYHALLASTKATQSEVATNPSPVTAETTLVPMPVALPAVLDFGDIPKGVQQSLLFQLQNDGGVARNLQLRYSDDHSWFKVTKGRRILKNRPFPMEFAVAIDTNHLQVGKTYQGWVQVNLDEETTQVDLMVKVGDRKGFSWRSPRLTLAFSMLALLAIIFSVQLWNLAPPIFSLGTRNAQRQDQTLSEGAVLSTQDVESTTAIPTAELLQPYAAGIASTTSARQQQLAATSTLVSVLPMSTAPATLAYMQVPTTTVTDFDDLTNVTGRSGIKSAGSEDTLLPPIEYWAQRTPTAVRAGALVTTTSIIKSIPTSTSTVTSDMTPHVERDVVTHEGEAPVASATSSDIVPVALSVTTTAISQVTVVHLPNSTRLTLGVIPTIAVSLTDIPTRISANVAGDNITSTGSVLPTDVPSPTPTVATTSTPLPQESVLPTLTPTPTKTPLDTPTPTKTAIPAATFTATTISTPQPTVASTATKFPSPTSLLPTFTSTAMATATQLPTKTPITTPTPTPLLTTNTPTSIATATATAMATPTPTQANTATRTPTPTATRTATATQTATATRTATTASTRTETATTTPFPTWTETATPTISPSPTIVVPTTTAGRAIVIIPGNYNVNARADTSTDAEVRQVLVSESRWIAIGRTIDSTWLLIQLNQTQVAWVFTTTVVTDPTQVAQLPIVLPEHDDASQE